MTTLKDWLRTIAFALNDDEPGRPFQRYAVKDLIAALNAALCLAASHRMDLFTELRVVKLEPGPHQDVRGCCSHVLEVMEQTDQSGNIITDIRGSRKTNTTVKRNWKKPSCLRKSGKVPGGFLLDNASIDPNMNGRFQVDPPVPCDADVYVRVKCVTKPCELTEADLNADMPMGPDCVLIVASWHYVLSTMLTGDRYDNAAGSQDKQYHYRMFFDILGITQRQEDRIESTEQA